MPKIRRNIRAVDLVAWAAPFVLIAALLGLYLIAPQFYLKYVLELRQRESQAVEMLTVACLAIALLPLAWATLALWKRLPPAAEAPDAAPARLLHRYGAATFVTLILLATLFFLGEEINWGQTLRLWVDPTYHIPVQTNVHNNIPYISVQGLGSIGMACAFFVAPLLWAFRRQLQLPPTLAPAIPEGPVICCLAVGMAWKWFKNVYQWVGSTAREDTFYWGFVEQINEQKELLVAMSLMLYALYRIAAVRRTPLAPAPSSAAETPPRELVGAARAD